MRLPEKTEQAAYRKVAEAFRKQRKGATAADIVAATALPLATVRDLVPRAADEYGARLEVTESGEIRYSFPRGFASRYRGFRAGFRKFIEKAGRAVKTVSAGLFKVWIMVMLVGYFVLFMLIALASLFITVAARSSSSDNRRGGGGGGFFVSAHIFDLIIRLWFYSTLTKSMDRRYGLRGNRDAEAPKGRPLHRAIFSFVFGDGDPNKDWNIREKKAFIAYVQANRGVISLPEFMALTGLEPQRAEEEILARCSEFGGSPEVTEEGTLVYRFDEILLRADREDRSFSGASPIKRLKEFSSNKKNMNFWFGLINTVNLIFGGYFFYNALTTGAILTETQFHASSYLYAVTYVLSAEFIRNPLPLIGIGLGLVPLVFSLLFWLVPGIRYFLEKKENEKIKLDNLKKAGFGWIWSKPLAVQEKEINSPAKECRPRNMAAARDRIIKDMGAYSMPEVELDGAGNTVYSFKELRREKEALARYRTSIDPAASSLGKIVFDSDS
ncbi:MAG: hypothetical protein LBG10_01250 [Treponema sp.]|jgi:hypothetical protein|nr:hypothetical protein [Treponema sp.]